MNNEEIANAVVNELTLAYMQAGSKIGSSNALDVAKSICESLDFKDADEVKAAFRRAKMMQDIPTQRTLAEALANHRAETYTQTSSLPLIENADPRAAWLPKSQMKRNINMMTAIRNLSAAISDREYMEYCKVHVTKTERRGDKEVPVYMNQDAALAFDRPKKKMLEDLYNKYWRMLPVAKDYPADAPLNHGLIPPTVPQFRVMLEHEAKVNGYAA
jgi:antitoxin component of MazEF toxin-antitoxin module